MAEKCFCHLNGFKVKDADARALILYLTKRVEVLEKLHEITPEDPPVDPPVDPDPDPEPDPDPDPDPKPETETCSVRTTSGDYGNSLIFIKGMTWNEWFTSEYYDPDFSVAMNGYVMLTGTGYLVDHTGNYVASTDTMIAGLQYEVEEPKTCSVDGKTLTFERGMAWGTWLNSKYRDENFSVGVNSRVMYSGQVVTAGENEVLISDTMISDYTYGVKAVEEPTETYTISYYKRNEYCKNGESDYTMQELITSHEYEEGSPITPLTLPKEEGYTASDWEYQNI